jgi:4'-phosphopantetheinyl transferase
MTASAHPLTVNWRQAPAQLRIQPGDVHLWQQNLQISSDQFNHDWSLLNAEEQAKASRFVFARHRRRYVAARAALRKLLTHYITAAPATIEFTHNAYGKPLLADRHNPCQLMFSVSHSAELAVYALTQEHEIGIDLERIRPLEYLSLARRFFADREYQALTQMTPARLPASFFQVWTQKEAFIKALGLGLHYPLDQFGVNAVRPAGLNWWPDGDKHQWTMREVLLTDDYRCHFATPQKVSQCQGWRL